MLKIAICDDFEKDRDKIMACVSNIEEQWNEEFHLEIFSSGEDLLEKSNRTYFDIILLDIIMIDGIDGIDTAKEIRKKGDESLIIFISSYQEKWRELFSFSTIAFIDKPIVTSKLEEAIKYAKQVIKKNQNHLFVYENNKLKNFIHLNSIVYFQSQGKTMEIHSKKNVIEYRDTLANVWEQVTLYDEFVKISKSHIFNLNYICISPGYITIIETGEVFNIGRKYKQELRDKHFTYMERNLK